MWSEDELVEAYRQRVPVLERLDEEVYFALTQALSITLGSAQQPRGKRDYANIEDKVVLSSIPVQVHLKPVLVYRELVEIEQFLSIRT